MKGPGSRQQPKTNPLRTWIPFAAWFVAAMAWWSLAALHNAKDTAWALVQNQEQSLAAGKRLRWQGRVQELSRLLRRLNCPEERVRNLAAELADLPEAQYIETLEDLRLKVEIAKNREAFKHGADWRPLIAKAKLLQMHVSERLRIKHEARQKREAQPQSLHQMLGEKPLLALLIVGGMLAAFVMTQPLELRGMRVIQLIVIPGILVGVNYTLVPAYNKSHTTAADFLDFMGYLPLATALAVILAPNLTYYVARAVQGTIDPLDYTGGPEVIELGNVRSLIHEQKFRQALQELDMQLKRAQPTYEAVFLRAKLLFHLGEVTEAKRNLLSLLRLSHTPEQQKTAMMALRELQ